MPFQNSPTLAFDIGGSKIAAELFSPELKSLAGKIVSTPQDYSAFVAACAKLADELTQGQGRVEKIGVGIAGWINHKEGKVSAPNLPFLAGKALRDDLTQAFKTPVQISNDANCAALAEAVDGAGKDYQRVLGLIMGTGLGAGFIVNRQIIEGPNGLTGEIGLLPLPFRSPDDGPVVEAITSQQGSIEHSINGAALTRLCIHLTGKELKPPQIAELAAAGDAEMLAVLDQYFETVAKAMMAIIYSFDPDVIVVSGGLSALPGLYEAVPLRWGKYCYNSSPATHFVPALHGPIAGLRGAAMLAMRLTKN